ncbi:MAG: aldo/keto reductase [Rhizobiales bacterium]|nr:aldo/keto reductase [Hyphomicrobiales bacterium]
MKYVRLGETGLKVSRLCLGCMSYGSTGWRPWVLEEDAARPFFRKAVESGITFFDTADYYSTGQSEEVTGRLLNEFVRRQDIVLATKVGLEMGPTPNATGLSRKHIAEGIEASLKRLSTDYVDLYQIHRLDHHTPMDEICEALDRAVAAGKVLYLGASSMAAWQFMKLIGIQRALGLSRFVSMQNHYNLLYREEEREMVPLCVAEGIGIIPWSPLARGVLTRPVEAQKTTRSSTDRYTPTLYGAAHDADIINALEAAAGRIGHSMAQTALAWLLAKPGVTAPIIGATKLHQLDEALGALEITLDPETISALEAGYRPRAVAGFE